MDNIIFGQGNEPIVINNAKDTSEPDFYKGEITFIKSVSHVTIDRKDIDNVNAFVFKMKNAGATIEQIKKLVEVIDGLWNI